DSYSPLRGFRALGREPGGVLPWGRDPLRGGVARPLPPARFPPVRPDDPVARPVPLPSDLPFDLPVPAALVPPPADPPRMSREKNPPTDAPADAPADPVPLPPLAVSDLPAAPRAGVAPFATPPGPRVPRGAPLPALPRPGGPP